MTLHLDRFQTKHPYPELHRVRPDKELAAVLLEGYSGEYSELTTVLQYNYHSLRLQKRFHEVALVMRGIFYVETLHMELLGDCANRLGLDPRYCIALRSKSVHWSGSLVDYYGSAPARMLQADLEGEALAAQFYEQTAASCTQPDIARLLARLAEDERLHIRMLGDLQQRFFR